MTHHFEVRVALVLLMLPLSACGRETEPGPLEEARFVGAEIPDNPAWATALVRARGTADALSTDLGGLVMSTLQEQGPVAALEVCSTVAQRRTSEHAASGVGVRRVSERLRNPDNAPDEWEARELEEMARLHEQGETPSEVVGIFRRGEASTLRYLRPITIAPPCLTCHGQPSEIAPEVAEILRQRYPDDRATGYRAGDLRGAVSVAVDLPPT
jgi:hypothetical protein